MDPQCYSHLFYIAYRRRSFLSVENKRISDVHMTDDRMINNHISDDHIINDRISDDHIIDDRIINDRISDDCFLSPLWSSEALLSVFLHSKKVIPRARATRTLYFPPSLCLQSSGFRYDISRGAFVVSFFTSRFAIIRLQSLLLCSFCLSSLRSPLALKSHPFSSLKERKMLPIAENGDIKLFRVISIARLNALLHAHLQPIQVVVYNLPSWISHLEVGFVLRCFQHLSFPHAATQPCHWRDN